LLINLLVVYFNAVVPTPISILSHCSTGKWMDYIAGRDSPGYLRQVKNFIHVWDASFGCWTMLFHLNIFYSRKLSAHNDEY
jgi:hypothetical protein